jgi:hypothetical protein
MRNVIGTFKLDPDGQGVFEGTVSLENNGASPWYVPFDKMKVNKDDKIIIKLKGDGKKYELNKDNSSNYYSYISSFTTSGTGKK